MALSVRAASGFQSAAATTTPFTITLPTGTTTNDLVLIVVSHNGIAATLTQSAGTGTYTNRSVGAGTPANGDRSASGGQTAWLFSSTVASGDTAPSFSIGGTAGKYSWVAITLSPASGQQAVWSSMATPTVESGSGTSHTPPAFAAGALSGCSVLLNAWRGGSNVTTAITTAAPTNWVEPANADFSTAIGSTSALRQVAASASARTGQTGTITPGAQTTTPAAFGVEYHVFAVEQADLTSVVGSDSGALTEGTSSITQSSSTTDTGTLTEGAAAVARTSDATDTGTLSEGTSVLVQVTSLVASDAGTLTEGTSSLTSNTPVVGVDSGALTETSALAVTLSVVDSGALTEGTPQNKVSKTETYTLTEVSALTEIRTATDEATLDEGVPQVKISKTETYVMTEGTTSVSRGSSSDDAAALTEAATIARSSSGDDTGALTEESVLDVFTALTASDAGSLADQSSVSDVTAKAASDTGTLTEGVSVLSVITSITASDAGSLTEALAQLAQATSKVGSDGASLVETSATASAVTALDAAALAEASSTEALSGRADTAVLTESSSLTIEQAIPPFVELTASDAGVLAEVSSRRTLGLERTGVTGGTPSTTHIHGRPVPSGGPIGRPIPSSSPGSGTPIRG